MRGWLGCPPAPSAPPLRARANKKIALKKDCIAGLQRRGRGEGGRPTNISMAPATTAVTGPQSYWVDVWDADGGSEFYEFSPLGRLVLEEGEERRDDGTLVRRTEEYVDTESEREWAAKDLVEEEGLAGLLAATPRGLTVEELVEAVWRARNLRRKEGMAGEESVVEVTMGPDAAVLLHSAWKTTELELGRYGMATAPPFGESEESEEELMEE